MTENILKQSNGYLRSLLDEYRSDPVTEENGVEMIIASVELLKKSRADLQIQYERQKAYGEELQRQLGATVTQFQNCSNSEVPTLKQKLSDLQAQFDAISTEMNVTASLVIPLQQIVAKGHDDLKKCIDREQQILATLTSKNEIAATAVALVQKPVYEVLSPIQPEDKYQTIRPISDEEKYQTVRAAPTAEPIEDPFVDASEALVTEIPDEVHESTDGIIHHVISDIPLRDVTAAQLREMNPFTLHGYAEKNNIPDVEEIEDLVELRNEIWRYKQSLVLSNQSVEQIATWNREKLVETLADVNGMFRSRPVQEISDEVLRSAAIDDKRRDEWYSSLEESDPVLLAKLERATSRQLVKWIKQYEPTFTVDDIKEEDLDFALFWKAIDIAVNRPRITRL
jgi:hypothetical protein